MVRRLVSRRDPRIVVIGGGTGSFTMLQSLKKLTPHITALVNMADDGGSSGTLRDELGVLPPGDVRQCLVALSDTPKLRDVFNYRFDSSSLEGHSFGNLFLTVIEKLTGNFAEAIETASEVLNITGRVIPVTMDNVRLVLNGTDGRHIEGEHRIDKAILPPHFKPDISLLPQAAANPDAVQAILDADIVVIAPGDLYTSLAPALVIPGIGEALRQSRAKAVYVCNLVMKPGHTDDMTVVEHAAEIERFVGHKFLDYVLYNTERPASHLVERYEADKEYLVRFDPQELKRQHYRAIAGKFVAGESTEQVHGDKLAQTRSLIRHDAEAVSRVIRRLTRAIVLPQL